LFRIASGSWDNTIKITNTNNGKCLQTLTGHSGVIYALELLEDEFFASGSYDGSIKIWNSSKGIYMESFFRAEFLIHHKL